MTDHAVGIGTCTQSMTIPSYLPSEMHLQKIPDQTEFQSWIVNFHVDVCAKAKNLALVLQWIKRLKQPARWRTSSIQINYGKRFLWLWRIGFWWRQNWNVATILLIWYTKLLSAEPWQDTKGENSHTERKSEECFQRKTIGSCSSRDACSFLHTHVKGDGADNAGRSGETQEILTWSKHTLLYRKWRHRLTWKAYPV